MKLFRWILAAALSATAAAQPANDTCATAIPIGDGLFAGGNVGASTTVTPSCGGGADVWYAYTAPCTGTAVAGFCAPGASASFDTVISAYTGACGLLAEIACSDDACGLSSQVSFPVIAGQVYFLAVSGFASAQGTFTLSVQCALPPVNDTCAAALPVGEGLFNGSSTGATTTVTPSCGGSNEVWYAYTAGFTGTAGIGFCAPGSSASFDTVLAVYTGSCGLLAEIACDDDTCGLGSNVNVAVTAGQTYFVSVGGFSSSQFGAFTLSIAQAGAGVPNDTCGAAIPVGEGLHSGSNANATQTATPSCGGDHDVWYAYTPAANGIATATLCSPGSAGFDTILTAWSGACGSLTELACDDDTCGLQSEIQFFVQAGQTYLLSVAGFSSGDAGSFTLSIALDTMLKPSARLFGLRGGGNSQVLEITTDLPGATVIGSSGFGSLSGMDTQPGTGTVFASSGFSDGGRLFTVDLNTGAATLVGPTGFPAVPGLAFDPNTGALYGSADTTGLGVSDGLISIDPLTGAGLAIGTYGFSGANQIGGIDAIAFDPLSGVLIGASGFFFDGSAGDIFTINPVTGAATLLGQLVNASGQTPPATLAGLAFDPDGRLYGSLGSGDGRIIAIDLQTMSFEILTDAASNSVTDIIAPCTTIVPYGDGCAGAGGFVPQLTLQGCPSPGETIQFNLTGGLGGAPAFVFLGTSQAAAPLGGGCFLNVSPAFLILAGFPLGGVGPGAGALAFPVVVPVVAPITVTLQGFVSDAASAIGASASNGVQVEIE